MNHVCSLLPSHFGSHGTCILISKIAQYLMGDLVKPRMFTSQNLVTQRFSFWLHPSVHRESFWIKHIRGTTQQRKRIKEEGLHVGKTPFQRMCRRPSFSSPHGHLPPTLTNIINNNPRTTYNNGDIYPAVG